MTTAAAPAALHVLRDALVQRGWDMIETLERMEPKAAERLLKDRLKEQADAAANLAELHIWPSLPTRNLHVYKQRPNQVRIRRVLDLISSEDRVVDIGTNYGYLTGVLLKSVSPSYYCGIDLADHLIEGVREMLRANELSDENVVLERKDLYDIDTDWMALHRPDIVVLLEVLEHVPDPLGALKTLASSMPAHASVAFSVPILGRLEACWGHVSLFDATRVRQLCDEAGLHVQHVEHIYNTWTLVVATPSPEASPRLLRLLEQTAPPAVPEEHVRDYAFVNMPLKKAGTQAPSRWTKRCTGVTVIDDKGFHRDTERGEAPVRPRGGLPLRRAKQDPQTAYLGAALKAADPRVLRLELLFRHPENIRTIFVDAYGAGGGKPVERWVWDVTKDAPPPEDAKTHVLRRGQGSGPFRSKTSLKDRSISTIEVFVHFDTGRDVGFTIRRAAYVR